MEAEDYRRPNHADFQTSSELAAAGFSGSRHNSITDDVEFWVLGNLEAKVTAEARRLNPRAVEEAMENLFALTDIKFDRRDENRKKQGGQF